MCLHGTAQSGHVHDISRSFQLVGKMRMPSDSAMSAISGLSSLADDPLANEIYPKTGRKILPPARPACVVCGRPHDETDGRNGVCSACISIAERVLARTTVRAAGTPAPSAPKSEPKASGPETAASEDKPSDTAYER